MKTPRLGKLQGGLVEAQASVRPEKRKQHLSVSRSMQNKPGRINLKAVAEVLAEKGFDPTEQILRLLTAGEDKDGKPLPPLLDADVQARMWNELLQYTQPKLKSVEVKSKGAIAVFDVSDDQAKRLAEEFLKASIGGDE